MKTILIQKYASHRSLQKYTKIFSGVILVVRCRCTPSIVAKLSVCCSSQLGIIQLLYPLMLHYRASLLPIISNVLRTDHSPSERTAVLTRATTQRLCICLTASASKHCLWQVRGKGTRRTTAVHMTAECGLKVRGERGKV